MGSTLLLMGLGLLYAQINEQAVLEWAARWWPLVFIFLGAEVLWQSYQAKKTDSTVGYDILSVFIIGLLLCFGLGMQALSETGVIAQGKTMLVSQNYELQQNSVEIPLDSALKEVVIEGSSAPLDIFSRPTNKISASVRADVVAPSQNVAGAILQQNQTANVRREGDTLYLSFTSGSPVSNLSPGIESLQYSLYLPEQLKVTIHSEYTDLDIHARSILNDWYIDKAQSIDLDLPATSNLQLMAQVDNRSDLQGNAPWVVKESPPASEANAQEYEEAAKVQASLNLGSAQHKMTINSSGALIVDLLP